MLRKTETLDKKTLVEARDGNLIAFERIVYVYEKPMLNYVYRLVKKKEDAEDLTQETFIHLYKNISRIDPENNFRAWLYKIATNVVYDWWRKRKNIKEISLINTFTGKEKEYEGPSPDLLSEKLPSYNMDGLENAEDIARAMEELKPIYQLVLLLFYFNDLNYEEISEVLSIPLWNVKTHLYRARQSLKEILVKHGFKPAKVAQKKQNYGLSFSKN